MISYIRHNSVFDLGSRTGTSTCVGLYKELDDIYSKYFNPQVHVQYNDTDCLCNMSGKQTLSGGSHAFVFHNGTISVTVDEQDNVTVAPVGSGSSASGGVNAFNLAEHAIVKKVPIINDVGEIDYQRTQDYDSTIYTVFVSANGEARLFSNSINITTGSASFPFVAYSDGLQIVPTFGPDEPIVCSPSTHYTNIGYYVVGGTVSVYYDIDDTPLLAFSDDALIVYYEGKIISS